MYDVVLYAQILTPWQVIIPHYMNMHLRKASGEIEGISFGIPEWASRPPRAWNSAIALSSVASFMIAHLDPKASLLIYAVIGFVDLFIRELGVGCDVPRLTDGQTWLIIS